MYACVCTYVGMCVESRGQPQVTFLMFYLSCYLKTGSLMGLGLTKYDRLASSEPQESAFPHLPAWDYRHTLPCLSTFV